MLNHTSKEIVYNCLGIIINCFTDLEIKYKKKHSVKFINRKAYGKEAMPLILQVLKDCTIDDYDMIFLAL